MGRKNEEMLRVMEQETANGNFYYAKFIYDTNYESKSFANIIYWDISINL